jgi:hypothetical protein
MDRRTFLASLAALGAASLPFRASEATELQVDEAWARVQEEPCWFEVCDRTILVAGGDGGLPATRREVYDSISEEWLRTPSDVEDCVLGCSPLYSHFATLAEQRKEEIEELLDDPGAALSALERRRLRKLLKALVDDLDEGWRDWVQSEGRRGMPVFLEHIGEWLDAPPDWDEAEWFPRDFGPQGEALSFFQQLDRDVLRALDVVIVDGEHPGSSYFAAELRCEPEEANDAAVRLRLPIRFRAS